MTWELASQVATVFGPIVAAVGLGFVAYQLYLQRGQRRFEFLMRLYAEVDTPEARQDRAYIYTAPPDELRMDFLHSEGHEAQRRAVEDTLAKLDRMAYPISTGQVPFGDAFALYAGVVLSISKRLWPYVEDQRAMRADSVFRRGRTYRRHLENLAIKWAGDYAAQRGCNMIVEGRTTLDVLTQIFPDALPDSDEAIDTELRRVN